MRATHYTGGGFTRQNEINRQKPPKCALFVLSELEEIVRAHGFAGEAAAGGDDRRDAAACRLPSAHPDAKKVLAGGTRTPREVLRLDPTTLEELFQSRRHNVQYIAHYAKAGTLSINIARGQYFSHLYASKRLFRLHPVAKFPFPSLRMRE